MKKFLCFILTIALVFSFVTTAEAKNNGKEDKRNHNHQDSDDDEDKDEEKDEEEDKEVIKEKEYHIWESSYIQYKRYKLPIEAITEGMGANLTYDKSSGVVNITKGSITIIIDFKHKKVTVNGVADTHSGIFTARNNKKTIIMLKYIAKILGVNTNYNDDNVIVCPGLDAPTNVTITPVGTVVVANTLNSTSLYLNAAAKITAGQATGGKAELYVGSRLVATDTSIAATDTSVAFTTSDGSPTTSELMNLIPVGGVVKVRLYNSNSDYVVSSVANPTLSVDYVAPVLSGITSAFYNASANQLIINVTGAGAVGDVVDVTKLSLIDSALSKTYQLTNTLNTGSYGAVTSATSLVIYLGSSDRIGLSGFGASSLFLNVAAGSLLKDSAGNLSAAFTNNQIVPVTKSNVPSSLDAPTNITIVPVGTTVIANTLNTTTHYMDASARITAGQATGGRAELYVGSRWIGTDSYIAANDTYVTFTTSDGTPTNSELQASIPTGGVVTVKLYNSSNISVTSTVGNPTLTVDYIAPTLSNVTSAIYDAKNNQIFITASGAGAIGDTVDVTKIFLMDTVLSKTYQLTNTSGTGSYGSVTSANSIVIYLGSTDRLGLSGFGTSTVFLTVTAGSLLKDTAGNLSPAFIYNQTIPVSTSNAPTLLDAPTNITVVPIGTTVLANTINVSTLYMDVNARITAGQATGGKAELYVGSRLIATDSYIAAYDTFVSFTTSDGTPLNSELQALVPTGGLVTVKLYNSSNYSVTSTVGNPTLTVDYIAPTLSNITSAIYDTRNGQIFIIVSGAGAIGDTVDVTKIAFYDTTLGRTYQLTNASGIGSSGTVSGKDSLVIKVGSVDNNGLTGFGTSTVWLTVYSGSLIKDAAGNTSPVYSTFTGLPVTVIK